MSNNIWGYQGLQTPLENLTQGNYNVADYTNMRKEFSARLSALENAGGFQPTNVTISGFCSVVPGSQGYGNLTTSGYAQVGGYLTVAGAVTCNAGLTVTGTLQAGSLSFADISATSASISGNCSVGSLSSLGNITSSSGSITGLQFVGGGAGLTGVTGTDATKLPLTGGTLTGALTVSSGALTVSSGNITATSGQFVGNGAGLTGITSTDPTKLPLAGGTMTGSITSQSISVLPGYTIYNNKGNKFSFFSNTYAGPFIVNQQNGSVHDYIKLLNNTPCTVSLVNLVTTDNQNYQDQQRLATITKRNMVNGDYSVSVVPPLNYVFNSKGAINASTYTIPLGVFSVTFMINSVSSQLAYEIDVISTVTV